MKDDVQTSSLTMSVEAASKALGISRCLGYEMARQGKIPTIRLGRRLLVSRKGLDELLSAKATPANG
jgi:excisionase family DNA binding protein